MPPDPNEEDRIRDLALEYSQKKQFLNCDHLGNWLRAENQIRVYPAFRPWAEKASESVRSSAELAGRLLTLIALLTTILVVVGSLFLVNYLDQVGAPLPPIDSSTSVFSFSLAFAFAGMLFLLLLLLLAPFVMARTDKSLINTHRTFFFRQPLKDHKVEYLSQYVRYFLPFLLAMIAFSAALLWRNLPWVIGGGFLLGCVTGGFLLSRKRAGKAAFETFWTMVVANGMSLLWALFGFILGAWFLEKSLPHTWDGICLLLIVALHAVLNALSSSLAALSTILLLVMIVAAAVSPGPAFVAGKTLRSLGLGGGLPINLVLNSNPVSRLDGCLILSTGTQLTIMTPPDRDCISASPRVTLFGQSGQLQSDKEKRTGSVVSYERLYIIRTEMLHTAVVDHAPSPGK